MVVKVSSFKTLETHCYIFFKDNFCFIVIATDDIVDRILVDFSSPKSKSKFNLPKCKTKISRMTFIRQNIKLNFWDTDVVSKVADLVLMK